MATITKYLEVELRWEFETDVEPYRPAQLSGPPESCYPAEGGFASVIRGRLADVVKSDDNRWYDREELIQIFGGDERAISDIEDDLYDDWASGAEEDEGDRRYDEARDARLERE